MFNISSFLQKFKSRELAELHRIEVVIIAVKKEAGIDLKETAIRFDQGRISISASPIEKNEIFMKKKAILDAIQREFPSKRFTDLV